MFHIVLVSPKIPQNTGNIGRTCVALGYTLHIVKPIPFEINDKQVKRAGLDYWPHLDLHVWENLEQFLEEYPLTERHFFLTTKGKKAYFDAVFKPGDFLYFGSEDSGLPEDFMRQNEKNMLRLDMRPEFRSLNLSSTVCAVSYEAFRQNREAFPWAISSTLSS